MHAQLINDSWTESFLTETGLTMKNIIEGCLLHLWVEKLRVHILFFWTINTYGNHFRRSNENRINEIQSSRVNSKKLSVPAILRLILSYSWVWWERRYPQYRRASATRTLTSRTEVRCLAGWNSSVSHNESECLCFNTRCTNLSSQSTEREKISTSGCHFCRPGRQNYRCLMSLPCND